MAEFERRVRFAGVHAYASTDLWILCEFSDGRSVSIPRNNIDDSSEVQRARDSGVLVVSEWIAKLKGLS